MNTAHKTNTNNRLSKVVNRIFYINVASLVSEDIKGYIDKVKETFLQGAEETREYHNDAIGCYTLWEDIFVPVRSGETKIEFMIVDL